jgi:hypothetical protein
MPTPRPSEIDGLFLLLRSSLKKPIRASTSTTSDENRILMRTVSKKAIDSQLNACFGCGTKITVTRIKRVDVLTVGESDSSLGMRGSDGLLARLAWRCRLRFVSRRLSRCSRRSTSQARLFPSSRSWPRSGDMPTTRQGQSYRAETLSEPSPDISSKRRTRPEIRLVFWGTKWGTKCPFFAVSSRIQTYSDVAKRLKSIEPDPVLALS